jgi:uncharacterized membrane protein
MLMKTSAVRILRAFGFRIVLVADAVISAAFLFGYSLFRPDTPHVVIFLALLEAFSARCRRPASTR